MITVKNIGIALGAVVFLVMTVYAMVMVNGLTTKMAEVAEEQRARDIETRRQFGIEG